MSSDCPKYCVDFELRDLTWAVIASRHPSLRQAAETLNVRQSTLSRRLRHLEDRVGTKLFERTNGGTRPTPIGSEFIASANRILEETSAVLRTLKARSRGESGPLTIGVCASFSRGDMYAAFMEYSRRFPDVEIHVVDGTYSSLLNQVAMNAVDVAIVARTNLIPGRSSLSLWSERVVVAIPMDHELSHNAKIQWFELANCRVLLPVGGSGPELETLLVTKVGIGQRPRILRHDLGVDRLLSLVSIGHGLLLLLEGATGLHSEGVVYRGLHDGEEPTRVNFTAHWCETSDNPSLAPFIEMLKEKYPDLSPIACPPDSSQTQRW
jgi:DNA-binding transcriptional LysR family regulator